MTSVFEQTKLSGFTEHELSELRAIISRFPRIEKVLLFGSRAKGCADRGSDVDLAVIGDSVSDDDIFRLHEKLSEESNLPYFFDLLNYPSLQDEPLKSHINRVGIAVYDRSV